MDTKRIHYVFEPQFFLNFSDWGVPISVGLNPSTCTHRHISVCLPFRSAFVLCSLLAHLTLFYTNRRSEGANCGQPFGVTIESSGSHLWSFSSMSEGNYRLLCLRFCFDDLNMKALDDYRNSVPIHPRTSTLRATRKKADI